MYKPKNLWITDEVKDLPQVIQIKNKILQLDPNVNIKVVFSNRPEYVGAENDVDRFHEMKQTLLLCKRRGSFIETFASPGHIVEAPATMVKTLMNCCSKCEYCYLARTAIRQQWQKIYVNFDQLEQEMLNEVPIHTGLMTILSAYSQYEGEPLLKIPKGFKELSDSIRNELSKKGSMKVAESDVFEYLFSNLGDILLKLDCTLARDRFFDVKKMFENNFKANKIIPFSFNVSEYSDILAIEHIAGHLDYLMGIINRNPQLKMHFFTKSANSAALLKHHGDNRVKITMNFNTDYAIENYEHGTPSLKERINALQAIQTNGTFLSVVHLEPAIMYPDYKKDYMNLIGKIFKKVDPNKIDKVVIGMVRYSGQLLHHAKKLYPDSDMLDNAFEFVEPEYRGDRYRYDFDERIKFYKMMIAEIRKYSDCKITLGAENPDVWEALKMNTADVLQRAFVQ